MGENGLEVRQEEEPGVQRTVPKVGGKEGGMRNEGCQDGASEESKLQF